MKYLHVLAMAVTMFFVACDKESTASENDLPAAAKTFISTHYGSQEVTRVIKDRDNGKVSWDVFLNNGTKLEFNKDGDLDEIEGTERIPDSVLPASVLQYVDQNYPGTFVRSWDVDDNHNEARLSNGIELIFDKDGNFVRVDD